MWARVSSTYIAYLIDSCRKRKLKKTKQKVEVRKLTEAVDTSSADYKCSDFCFRMQTFVLRLPIN